MSLNGISPWYTGAAVDCGVMFRDETANRCFLQCKKMNMVVKTQSALVGVSWKSFLRSIVCSQFGGS
jgi:hypothetical protein